MRGRTLKSREQTKGGLSFQIQDKLLHKYVIRYAQKTQNPSTSDPSTSVFPVYVFIKHASPQVGEVTTLNVLHVGLVDEKEYVCAWPWERKETATAPAQQYVTTCETNNLDIHSIPMHPYTQDVPAIHTYSV